MAGREDAAAAAAAGVTDEAKLCNLMEQEVSEDEYVQVGGVLERRKRKATVTPGKLQISKIETPHKLQISEVQTPHKLQISEVETPHQLQISEVEIKSKEVQALVLAQDSQRISQENENLRLQLALKTKELEHEENQKLRLQLELKNKDIESLKKQNDELKAEIEYYKKTTKPPRVARRCRWCEEYTTHDYRNCPQRRSY
ncbi:hypothetical protein [Oryza sativa Japonica Group]|uniref:Os01g0147600 protein n=1 Tax=Oryza sativa subsp. japonica TaxID=39947 RepID=Q5ZDL6_ORYSJ|nr:hypothetical protein OsJ_00364 [Oryza sativa Japonica Group]BAD61125.1 hypothetical protein [Oryza sativa Japonica Group]BAD61268.1 hypothetical protein [Oryza sativa Japonica Group]BAH90912.1 Os01g0147600 [Oryza sativa Japonica Group]|eukprot:NP_001172182.1 Os01g0147600 [Oryza sativa Japonica Group]